VGLPRRGSPLARVLPGQRRLTGRPPAVDGQHDAGDGACNRAGEEDDRAGDLVRLEQAAERNPACGRSDERPLHTEEGVGQVGLATVRSRWLRDRSSARRPPPVKLGRAFPTQNLTQRLTQRHCLTYAPRVLR
jgi:hypothetical protein